MIGQHHNPIFILIVEDSVDDTDLIHLQLQKDGLNAALTRVETESEFRKALSEETWDLILSDYSLPEFDGLSALKIVQELGLDIPFILISGKIGEDIAVQAMKKGAHDYIIKDNLNRLVPAIKRELKEASIRSEHRQTQEERKLLINVLESSLNEVYIFDIETLRFVYANDAALNNLGYTEEEIAKFTAAEINPNIADEEYKTVIKSLQESGDLNKIFVTEHLRSDGSRYPIEVQFSLIEHNNNISAGMIGIDLTNQKRDQNIIWQQKKLARELQQQSEYKSAFLANMSHELRTPLNTIILLSDLMQKNREENLSKDQIYKLNVIKRSSDHLLELINQVLDLSKVEAGQLQFELDTVQLTELKQSLEQIFQPIAEEKGLHFEVSISESDDYPESIITDSLRLRQTLKNLLSNSFKFTESGSVTLTIFKAENDQVAFRVKDTGIGIPKNKQKLIFRSFQQADSSTSRNFGGTGLGLSIAKEFSESLGGSIALQSKKNEGAEFTVFLPIDSTPFISDMQKAQESTNSSSDSLQDTPDIDLQPAPSNFHSTNSLPANDTVLFYSSDQQFNESTLNAIHDTEQRVLFAQNAEHFWQLAKSENPVSLVIDVISGDYSGWTILKQLPNQSQIPTALLLNRELENLHSQLKEKSSIFLKPLSKDEIVELLELHNDFEESEKVGSIMLVDDSEIHSEVMMEFFSDSVQKCDVAFTAKNAYKLASKEPYDVVVLDLTLPDSSGEEVLKKLKADSVYHNPDVIIYSGRQLNPEEEKNLRMQADGVITKNIGSINNLKNQVNKLLKKRYSNRDFPIPEPAQNSHDIGLEEAHILITDDDYNSYLSLKSHLEDIGLEISYAENGKKAVEWLTKYPGKADAVMLDMMMPEMDGYEALKIIRNDLDLNNLPIFALTAKAMKGDREQCLNSGATDYISKPIDMNRVKYLLQFWLS